MLSGSESACGKRCCQCNRVLDSGYILCCDGFSSEQRVSLDFGNFLLYTCFSGGQGRCISIARAMFRDADYLLLDEATSNLDVLSEALVTDALNHLMQGKTLLCYSERENHEKTKSVGYTAAGWSLLWVSINKKRICGIPCSKFIYNEA